MSKEKSRYYLSPYHQERKHLDPLLDCYNCKMPIIPGGYCSENCPCEGVLVRPHLCWPPESWFK